MVNSYHEICNNFCQIMPKLNHIDVAREIGRSDKAIISLITKLFALTAKI